MSKNTWAGIAILSLLLSACGGAPIEPTLDAPDIQSTAAAMAATIIAETNAAVPTNTSVPPTGTPAPTDTPVPSPTADLSSPTAAATFTSPAPTKDPCDKILSGWQGSSANLNLVYEYSPISKDDKVVVSIWVKTDLGECGFLPDLSTGPAGQYSVAAYIDGTKDFKVFGGFRITEASWDIVIRNDTIVALGSCYPNC
jgi:hypothetical protein